jgi:WD40 repeat protein
VAFHPDSRWMATWNGSTVHVWKVATGAEVRVFKDSPAGGLLAFRPDGKQLAVLSGGYYASTVSLWEVASGLLPESWSS